MPCLSFHSQIGATYLTKNREIGAFGLFLGHNFAKLCVKFCVKNCAKIFAKLCVKFSVKYFAPFLQLHIFKILQISLHLKVKRAQLKDKRFNIPQFLYRKRSTQISYPPSCYDVCCGIQWSVYPKVLCILITYHNHFDNLSIYNPAFSIHSYHPRIDLCVFILKWNKTKYLVHTNWNTNILMYLNFYITNVVLKYSILMLVCMFAGDSFDHFTQRCCVW